MDLYNSFSMTDHWLGRVRDFYQGEESGLTGVRILAAEVTRLMEILDPLLERNTEKICPSCASVCCINRHSYHDLNDTIYLFASGAEMPSHESGIDDGDPCQFLGSRGCTIRRRIRPYRCTWYFCEPLMAHLSSLQAVHYRDFIHLLESLTRSRQEMVREFWLAAGVKGLVPSSTSEGADS